MKIRLVRSIAAASLLSAGLVGLSGCNAENPDGTKTTVGKIEDKAGEIEKKVEDAGAKAGEKVKEGAVKAVDATGKVIKEGGEKLEGEGAAAVKEHIGEKAGAAAESTGKVIKETGEKIQGSVKKPE